ncbi:MAG: cobyric acid synthase [Desulfobacterales bacterium]|nr:cobyric acid synthase [Desulfobacterales bacterium]MDD4391231.1 cobyric acid synthase [Desulfobacterales bacterium]
MESKNNPSAKAPCIAVFGTGSDVGKSIVVTALCRLFVNNGMRVAPFKAQNMSNNSGVTPEGLEMGRAQIVQAEAARIAPHVDMNPILLKPTSDVGAQVILMGQALNNRTAREYHQYKTHLINAACDALDRLRRQYDMVILEGAGSCAEVNLMSHDIVNFKMAEYAEAPVILVGDIHRGGIFAQLIGTLACLPEHCRDRIKGFIINRFRGDLTLFEDGTRWIEQTSKKPVLGVLPWYRHITIEAEDSVIIENPEKVSRAAIIRPAIAIVRIPHISNFTDFDPLFSIPALHVHFIEKVQELSLFDAVILPGSKNTCHDLRWLHQTGWACELNAYAEQGGHILGICGGYQMMGSNVIDPEGLEGSPGTTRGLALLPIETILKAPKTTTLSRFSWDGFEGTGYEIHMGQTQRFDGRVMFQVKERNGASVLMEDGCISPNENIMGTYMHGLFDSPDITRQWLTRIGLSDVPVSAAYGPAARDTQYDLLAAHFKTHIDTRRIMNELTHGYHNGEAQ